MIKFIIALTPKPLKRLIRSLIFSYTRFYADRNSFARRMLAVNWNDYKKDLHPKDRRMKVLDDRGVRGMSTENVRFMVNEIVKRCAAGGVYLEVGMFQGCSLLSAAYGNLGTRCIGIDDFSQFNEGNKNELILKENLAKFPDHKNIETYNQNYQKAIESIFGKEPGLKVDVYYYDGEHSYENQMRGLEIILPHLADKCVILVDDINWTEVQTANDHFIQNNPGFKSILRIKTKANQSADWWNGFEVIVRGKPAPQRR